MRWHSIETFLASGWREASTVRGFALFLAALALAAFANEATLIAWGQRIAAAAALLVGVRELLRREAAAPAVTPPPPAPPP